MRVELEHRAIVITKPEPRRRQGAYIGIDDIGDVMKPEQSQNFFFDVVFGPKYLAVCLQSRKMSLSSFF